MRASATLSKWEAAGVKAPDAAVLDAVLDATVDGMVDGIVLILEE